MEDAVPTIDAGETANRTPPPPPEPNADSGAASIDSTYSEKPDEPLSLQNERWDITSISALAALRMFTQALETLAEATGDVPPTPPVSRPTTPSNDDNALQRLSSPEAITIGSPEAHPHEPISVVGAGAEDVTLQHAAIGRRFFSKVAPPFTLSEYLHRLHKYCPHSPGVYLAAASYCHRLCVAELMVPATSRTIHRLALASIRISAKALEDNKWTQDRISQVGGITKTQLMNMEVALCFLLDFDLWVDDRVLATRMFLLQQAAKQGLGAHGNLGDSFKLKLPLRNKRFSVG